MAIVFGADLWRRPDDYQPPVIHHPDQQIMALARILLNSSPEHGGRDRMCSGVLVSPWEYQMRGATQDSEYYAKPYRHVIAEHIEMAVAVIAALRAEGVIPA